MIDFILTLLFGDDKRRRHDMLHRFFDNPCQGSLIVVVDKSCILETRSCFQTWLGSFYCIVLYIIWQKLTTNVKQGNISSILALMPSLVSISSILQTCQYRDTLVAKDSSTYSDIFGEFLVPLQPLELLSFEVSGDACLESISLEFVGIMDVSHDSNSHNKGSDECQLWFQLVQSIKKHYNYCPSNRTSQNLSWLCKTMSSENIEERSKQRQRTKQRLITSTCKNKP